MSLLQLLTLFFVGFAWSRVLLRFRDKAISRGEFFFWSGIWIFTLFLVFNPGFSDHIAQTFGIQRGTDTIFFLTIILLFYLNFRLYVKLDILDRTLTNLASNTSKALHRQKHS